MRERARRRRSHVPVGALCLVWLGSVAAVSRAEEGASAPRLRQCLKDACPAAIQVIFGGLGVSSSEDPKVWTYNADCTVTGKDGKVEEGLFVSRDFLDLIREFEEGKLETGRWSDRFLDVARKDVNTTLGRLKALIAANKDRPVVLIGHSLGGWAVMDLARKLMAEGIAVDLVVLIDMVDVTSPHEARNLPGIPAPVAHVRASKVGTIKPSTVQGSVEYTVSDTEHTTIDDSAAAYQIIRMLMRALPKTGLNHWGLVSTKEYDPVALPRSDKDDRIAAISASCKQKIEVREAR